MIQTFLVFNFIVAGVCITRIIERRWPIAAVSFSEVLSDWKAAGISLALPALLAPLTAASSGLLLSWFGHGWIHLPVNGGWYLLSLCVMVLIDDLYSYSFHRLQHAVPFLWSMHSFHHSATVLTFATGARHLWLERVMVNAFLPIIAILFRIPADMQLLLSIIHFLPDTCAHMNLRIPMGRMITWVNSPQWHRVHHSALPQHYDKNFCSVLPLWDILFGTAWIPGPDEYPPTGLVPAEHVDMVDSIIWPFRHLRRRKAAA